MNSSNLNDFDFNNSEEDKEIIEESLNKDSNVRINKNIEEKNNNNSNNKGKLSIIIISILLIIIIILLLIILLSKKDSNNENTNNNYKNNNEVIDDNNSNIKTYDVNSKNSKLIMNKYVFINEDNKIIMIDLAGNKLDSIELKNDEKVQYYNDTKNAYLLKYNDKKGVLYKLDNNKLNELYSLEGNNYGFIKDDSNNIIGSYDSYSNKEIVYLFNKEKYDKVIINDYSVASTISESIDKNVYNNKYVITIKSNSFGIYDVKEDKEIIEPKYKKIEYLNKNYFAALENEKYGIIDTDDKTILDFKYSDIKYSNDLYFAIINNTLKVFNSNLKEIASVDNINDSTNRIKISTFKDKVIYLANRAIAIDKNGTVTDLDFDNYSIYSNYLITSKDDSTIVTLYDKNLQVFGEYDTKTRDNNLDNTAIYLNSVLILNGGQCFDLNTKASKGNINLYRRTSQDYLVTYELNKDGKITVFYNDNELGSVTGVKLMDFLNSDNNGIKITKDYFIYNAGDVHFITKNIKEDKE